MPEYLAPGVYIEETSFRSKSIEGVSTSTTAFVGPARSGPVGGTPELLTSVADFERIYGGAGALSRGSSEERNYLALAVRAYFENGGSRLYVARVFQASSESDSGVAAKVISGAGGSEVKLVARFPGRNGNGSVTLREAAAEISGTAIARLSIGTTMLVPDTDPADEVLVRLGASGWLTDAGASAATPTAGKVVTLSVTAVDADGNLRTWEGLGYDKSHPLYVGSVLTANPTRRADALTQWVALSIGSSVTTAGLRSALVGSTLASIQTLAGGNDGAQAPAVAFTTALATLEAVDDVSIVAAPGSSEYTDAAGIRAALISHVEKRGLYRVAVLDSAADDAVSDVRGTRGGIDSDRVALYYPWVTVSNPLARPGDAREPREINVPPSGAICGIYARNDVERGVWKSPANEVIRGAIRLERDVSFGENEVLNPLGVNCLRYFPGRGYRVWGARTATSDPEWKYLSVRRYFNYLEGSVERGIQWAVFEPNGPALWSNVRETISSFLHNEWRQGALLGETAREAFFVRCDLSTMDQNDLDNGRLVCLIGVAVVKPAEFVIMRIGQKTASARE